MTTIFKVSVLMLTYNHEDYVGKAIEGIISQRTKFKFNVVVFDDASLDTTQKILRKYKKKYPSIISLNLRKKNVGMMQNYSDLLGGVDGEYIALCEGDDYWTDNYKLQSQVDFLDKNYEYSISAHNVKVLNQVTSQTTEWLGQSHQETSSIEDIIRNGSGGATCSLVFRNDSRIIDEIKLLTKIIQGGDWLTQIICCKYGKMKYFPNDMAVYRQHAKGVSAAKGIDSMLDIYISGGISICEKINQYLNYEYDKQFRQNLATYFYPAIMSIYLDNKMVRNAKKYASKIIYEGLTSTHLSISEWADACNVLIFGGKSNFFSLAFITVYKYFVAKAKVCQYYLTITYKYFVRRKNDRETMAARDRDMVRLNKVATNQSKSPIKVHFGCGPRILKGWINIDLAYEPYDKYLKYYTNKHYAPSIRGSRKDFYAIDICAGPLPLADNSVDVIYHEDFIEHLTQKEQILFLAECYRILKYGGIHRINTPNLRHPMKIYSNFSLGYKGVYTDVWDLHIHKNILTKSTLREFSKLVGYKIIKFTRKNMGNDKRLPVEYRPDPNDGPETGSIFANLIK